MGLYTLGIRMYGWAIGLASIRSPKARAWRRGREKEEARWKEWRSAHPGSLLILHAASLGEYEQCKSLIAYWRTQHPEWKILISFFSPSGMQQYRSGEVDGCIYLPLDTPQKTAAFVDILQPDLFVFVRYDFWLQLIRQLKRRDVAVAVVSGFFREEMWWFRPWASSALKVLSLIDLFLTHDERSCEVLRQHHVVAPCICTGDGRVDRVAQLAEAPEQFPWLEQFKAGRQLVVIGSPWIPDEDLFIPLIRDFPDTCFLIAPHEVGASHVDRLMQRLEAHDPWRFSQLEKAAELSSRKVFVLDTIGVLASCYALADLAFVGGGFTTGIHSIQEPAAHGCPVFFGPRHQRFPEARMLIERGGAWEVRSTSDLRRQMDQLLSDKTLRGKASAACKAFINEHKGAGKRSGQELSKLILRSRRGPAGRHIP